MAVQLKRLDAEILLIVGYEDGHVALFNSVVDAWASPRLDVNAGWTLVWSHKLHREPGPSWALLASPTAQSWRWARRSTSSGA